MHDLLRPYIIEYQISTELFHQLEMFWRTGRDHFPTGTRRHLDQYSYLGYLYGRDDKNLLTAWRIGLQAFLWLCFHHK